MANTTPTRDTVIKIFIISDKVESELSGVISMFSGKSTSGRTSGNVSVIPVQDNDKYDTDYFTIYNCLSGTFDSDYVIMCKDTAVSTSPSSRIYDVLETAIQSNTEEPNSIQGFDLFYLAKWADRCDLYTNTRDFQNTGIKIVNSASPNGVLCLMFSPEGKAKFLEVFNIETNPIPKPTDIDKSTLGTYLHRRVGIRTSHQQYLTLPANQQKFYAATTTPTLVTFDIFKRKSDNEMIKTVECRDTPQEDIPNTNTSNMSIFWFFVIVVLACVLIYFIYVAFYSGSVETTNNKSKTGIKYSSSNELPLDPN